RISELAIMDGKRATWLVPVFADKTRLITTVAGYDLYNGLPGIALFLGQIGAVTCEGRFRRIVRAAMSEALALYEASDRDSLELGAFEGIGGLAYALVQIAGLVDRRDWLAKASAMLSENVDRAMHSSQLDLISGVAGFLAAALAIARYTNDAALLHQ